MAANADRKDRHVSLLQCATLLGRDRATVSKWIGQGCPVVQRADKARRVEWRLDLAEVVRWLEGRAAASVAEQMGSADGEAKLTTEEAKRRREIARMIVDEIEAAEAQRAVIKVADVLEDVAREYAEVRVALMSLPSKITSRCFGMADKAEMRDAVEELVRLCLRSLRRDGDSDGRDDRPHDAP